MLTALTCEREMLTFPLPARSKTLSHFFLHGFYFKKYFSIGLVVFGCGPSQKGDHPEGRSWSLGNKCPATRNVRGMTPFLTLPSVAVGARVMVGDSGVVDFVRHRPHSRGKSPRLIPSLCLRNMPKMDRQSFGVKYHCQLAYKTSVNR